MEPSNDSNSSVSNSSFCDDLETGFLKSILLSAILNDNCNDSYFKALEHCLKHVLDGGTIETFRPLIRTINYAGIDRRSPARRGKRLH